MLDVDTAKNELTFACENLDSVCQISMTIDDHPE